MTISLCRREMRHVALHVDFSLLAVRWSWQGDYTEYPRAHPLGDSLNCASFACAIASLKHDDYAQSLVLHPLLKSAELRLKAEQLLFVLFPLQLRLIIISSQPARAHCQP